MWLYPRSPFVIRNPPVNSAHEKRSAAEVRLGSAKKHGKISSNPPPPSHNPALFIEDVFGSIASKIVV